MLTVTGLLARNVRHHRRGNLAVLLGVAVGSAVLTGALLVGDSLRGSLRERAERQLAGIDSAALLLRPVRAEVADGLPGKTAPVLLLQGSLQLATADPTARVLTRLTALGVDARFAPAGVEGIDWDGPARTVALSRRVADRLGAKAGDRVRLGVTRFSDVPRSSQLAKRSLADTTATVELTVAAILPDDSPGNDFSLTPSPAAPLNVFLPIRTLSRLATGEPEPRANALLASGATADELNVALRGRLRPEDYGLRFREVSRRGYLSVESEELLLSPAPVSAVEAAAKDAGLRAEPTIVYVADTLAHGDKEIPYPIVAGLNPAAAEPLGPFLPAGVASLADGEVVLLEWPGSPLNKLPTGTKLRMTYFDPDVEGEGRLKPPVELTLRGYIPLSGPARDPNITPEIRGVTDARADLYNWDRPPVLPNAKIRARVPEKPPHPRGTFFNTNKATPMAYVNLATGQKLFGNRYGSVTSIRVAGDAPEKAAERLRAALPKHLDPAAAGIRFDPVRARLLESSRGGTDFGGLFLGFSLFLIAAALMLVGLLFRLALDRRAKEVGLLLAAGFSVRQVRRLLLAEGLVIAVVGSLLGLGLGIGYNRLLLAVLHELWPDPEAAGVLRPHASALSFALGFGLAVLMSLVALWLGLRGLAKVTPPALLRGETHVATVVTKPGGRVARWLAILAVPLGVVLLLAGGFVPNPDYRAMSFFGGGGLLLVAGLAGLWVWMKRPRHSAVNGRGFAALGRLGTRNAARNATRSLLTAALLAAAAFLLVAVESFRREPERDFLDLRGGSGGFNLLAEADVPLFQSFGDPAGRADLDRQLRALYGGKAEDAPPDPRYLAAKAELDSGLEAVFPLRLRGGDDASCLNLFQATQPRVLGVPAGLIDRGGFKFYETEATTPEEKANPWLLLRKPMPNGAVPVFCENNTAMWMLKTGVGGEVKVPGDDGTEVTFRIVGTLIDSPFQSELLTSDEHFVKHFPRQEGFRVFLVRTPPGKEAEVGRLLEAGLRANGLTATPTRDRVAAYQAVIGAYLSTFQLLGGFGLLLGVLGLAVVVLRGVWERLGELALLRAVGYRTRAIQFLVLAENALLLLVGLGAGVLAALASVAPHVAEGASVPWGRLAGMLALVLIVGLGVASAATAGILRVPVVPALRRE